MAEYIDRDVALDALDKSCDRLCLYPKKQRAIMCGSCAMGDAICIIEGLDAADVSENVKGTWIELKDGDLKCSECGYITGDRIYVQELLKSDTDSGGVIIPKGTRYWTDNYPYFCAQCGADMRGRKNDQ